MNTNPVEIGKRLSMYLAKNPKKESKLLKNMDISIHTLNRYKRGKSPKMPFIEIVNICLICELNINWLATGQTKIKKRDEEQHDLFNGDNK